ncbi:MFS transporter [Isoptericola sp. b441]|uniref:MFS transporter n=1 Tax=Actinotalea lenta TaxID=3064654 RepID=A0ABT9D6J5_9CELL|nr:MULTISPECIES: MFS transporter [unclassified Isoptericola]MDO8106457.1 MFS transporter [Isoptericola sp. b441]MDO8121827.1 MFS transporter [Isoptericola sp. b490]
MTEHRAPGRPDERKGDDPTADPRAGARDPSPEPGQDPRRWKALSVALTAGFMTLLDVSIVNVALPSIRSALDASAAQLQWVVSGYALTFGLVLVASGRLGDARGRRAMFGVGIGVFTVASVVAGLAPAAGWLVAARLVQGVGGGILNPQISGLVQQLFRGAERGRAFGRLGTTIGISTAVGPVLGGVILSVAGTQEGWRWVFLVNLPVGLLTFLLARHFIDPVEEPEPARDLDPVGAVLLGAGVVGLLWPLVSDSWQGVDAVLLTAGVLAIAGFWWWERRMARRGRAPMVRLSLFSQPGYAAGALLGLVYFSGFTGIFFVLTLFFQNGLGYTPLQAGLGLTPFAVGSAATATIGGRLVGRHGRRVVVGGLILVSAGLVLTELAIRARHGTSTGWWLAAPLLLAGLGSGFVISPNVTLTLENVPVGQAGTAGGVLQTGQRLGTAAGIALVGALYFRGLAATGDAALAASHGLRAALASSAVALVIGIVDLARRARRGSV